MRHQLIKPQIRGLVLTYLYAGDQADNVGDQGYIADGITGDIFREFNAALSIDDIPFSNKLVAK